MRSRRFSRRSHLAKGTEKKEAPFNALISIMAWGSCAVLRDPLRSEAMEWVPDFAVPTQNACVRRSRRRPANRLRKIRSSSRGQATTGYRRELTKL
jgi:hypothetical protein